MSVLHRNAAFAMLAVASLGPAIAIGPLFASPTFAGEVASSAPDDGVLKSVLKKANMATDDAGHPQDFVVKARPAAPSDYVPVFRKNEEHKTKLLTPDQLKAMEAELDAASSRNGRIRDAFPPARRAFEEGEREKAAKAASKHAKTPTTTAGQ